MSRKSQFSKRPGGKRNDREGTLYLVSAGGIGGQFPDWWDARIALDCDLPHYSMVECTESTMEFYSYALEKGTVGDTAKGDAAANLL